MHAIKVQTEIKNAKKIKQTRLWAESTCNKDRQRCLSYSGFYCTAGSCY